MQWLYHLTRKRETTQEVAPGSAVEGEWRKPLAQQRTEAEPKVILFHLDDRMRTFRPMMERVLGGIERETGLDIRRPKNLTYGFNDPYFPTYEWTICPQRTGADAADPRQVTLQLRASLGRDLTVIVVYYLLSFVDWTGDEHPLHQQPTQIKNEKLITELLWAGIKAAALAKHPGKLP